MANDLTIEPGKVVAMLENREKFLLLDCREPWENRTARIEGSTLIPMRDIPHKLQQIPTDQPVVVYCHAGMRSLDVASWLRQQGYDARSLSGGIDRWATEVDPTIPRY